MTRKRSVNKLKTVLIDDKPTPGVLHGMFLVVLKPILKLFEVRVLIF
jgi:hypothetical protein